MSTKKETLREANRTLIEYVNSNHVGNYVGEFSENEPISLALDGNFELTELMGILDIVQQYKLIEPRIRET